MADGGYDVADPCDVDPLFGTLADFDAFLHAAHEHGLRVTIDLVPNHVSNEHRWFVEAVAAGAGSTERERFIFRPGRGEHGELPPNNWPSMFGGPAWTRMPETDASGRPDGEWYLHLFAREQPDLNWAEPEVPAEFERIMRFWLDRGVDGFRVDVAHGLAKQDGLPDVDPEAIRPAGSLITPRGEDIRWDRELVHEYHRGMRRVLDSYPGDRMAVAEAWVSDPQRLARYVRHDEFNLAFNFELIEARWGADTFGSAIERSMTALSAVAAPCTWVLSNHDVPRAATRFGGGALGVRRARAAALVQLSLPGSVYLYNGDELGLTDVHLPDEALRDPTWERSGHTKRGRDGVRVPMPWSGIEPPYGFSTTRDTWLPMPDGWADVTVEAEAADPASTLSLFRRALAVRRELADLHGADFGWLEAPSGVLAYRRGAVTVLLNTSSAPVPLPAGEVLLASTPVDGALPPDTAVWLR